MTSEDRTEARIRKLRLAWPAEVDPIIVVGRPEESFGFLGMSLVLPHLEPYLIRSMNQAKSRITDPKLLSDIALFNGQEGQHYRQHARFNATLRLGAAESRVRQLEAEVAEDFRRFTETRSLRFNLAYAEGFEAFTMAAARFALETKAFDRMTPRPVRDLLEWHLVEELEHRTVAFDVYARVCGGYFYRLCVGLYAHWHLVRFGVRVGLAMAGADPKAFREQWGGRRTAWRRVKPFLSSLVRRLLPKVLATYLPWYSPHRVEMPADLLSLARHYTSVVETAGAASAATASTRRAVTS